MYYEMDGDGLPLIFVHAGIADHHMWDGQFEAFADRFQVIRYDMRGYGKSEPVAGPFMHREDLRGIFEVLDILDINSAVLVGCSMGGGMAIDFTLAYPERFNGLAVVGSSPSGFEGDDYTPPQWDQAVAAGPGDEHDRLEKRGPRVGRGTASGTSHRPA
ncbi:MAG: alpha/beta fold hydrolase [Chloroflexota bacterium]|nr:alpha/beta fold hydrolase [Chloroflexota bacterium]